MATFTQAIGFALLGGGGFYLLGIWLRPFLIKAARAHPLNHRRKRRRRLNGIPGGSWFWKSFSRRESREMDRAGLIYLHALDGLLKGGLSFPTALFQIVESDVSPFAQALRRQLSQFKRGEQLGNCLAHFRERSGVRESATVWRMLEVGYRRGLPLLPLLEKRLPGLEQDADLQAKLEGLWGSLLGQAGLVAVLPWAMLLVLGLFQPELFWGYRESALFWPTILGSLALEAAGLFFLGAACRYS